MKKFDFTLQTLLNVKISMEKQQTAELAAQNRIITQLEQELSKIKERIEESSYEYQQKIIKGGMTPMDISTYSVSFRVMYDRVKEWNEKIKRAQEVKTQIQKKLMNLLGERKALEKLKEKQYSEYIAGVQREQAKLIDDFLSTKIVSDMSEE